ncbi:MAG: hypothetical protein IPH16_17305 [Haliscomenobacter sp.]|nr:hypothetical protein [Haliscomenobacter sp.]
MQPTIDYFWEIFDYLLKNKEWLFDGIGIVAISGFFWIARRLFLSKKQKTKQPIDTEPKALADNENNVWHGIRPSESRFTTVTEWTDSIPAGLQTFSLEYGPYGHAHPLKLKGTKKGTAIRAEIQFTCQISNPIDEYLKQTNML